MKTIPNPTKPLLTALAACAAILAFGLNSAQAAVPEVAITSPAAGAPVDDISFTIVATATDSDGTITSVTFYDNDVQVGDPDTSAPYSCKITGAISGSSHVLTAKAIDNDLNETVSAAVSVRAATNLLGGKSIACNAPFNDGGLWRVNNNALDFDLIGTDNYWWYPTNQIAITGFDSNIATIRVWCSPYNNTNMSGFSFKSSKTDWSAGGQLNPANYETDLADHPLPLVTYPAPPAAGWTAFPGVDFWNNPTIWNYYDIAVSVPSGTKSLLIHMDNANSAGYSQNLPEIQAFAAPPAPPVVNITTPAASATVPPNFTISADATDDGSITSVTFFIDDVQIGDPDTAPPYSIAMLGATAGARVLTAKAIDNDLNETTSAPVSVTVTATDNLPVATLTSPADAASYILGVDIPLAATATDDGGVASVTFYDGDTQIGAGVLTAPDTYTLTWSGATAGPHTVKAVALDAGGQPSAASSASITVTGNLAPHDVTLTSPVNAAFFVKGPAILLAATALDDVAVARVEFLVDDVMVNADTVAPFEFSWSGATAGTHTVKAVAYDGMELNTASAVATITVYTQPSIVWGTPVNITDDLDVSLEGAFDRADSGASPTCTVNTVTFTDTLTTYSNPFSNGAPGTQYATLSSAVDSLTQTSTAGDYVYGLQKWATNPWGTNPTNLSDPYTTLLSGAIGVYTNRGATMTLGGLVTGQSYLVQLWTNNSARGSDQRQLIDGTVEMTSLTPVAVGDKGQYVIGRFTAAGPTQSFTLLSITSGTYGWFSAYQLRKIAALSTAPMVAITGPAEGSIQAQNYPFTISATAQSYNGAITKVEFYDGATLVGTDETAPYSCAATITDPGGHALTAKAFNSGGYSTVSAPVNITVAPNLLENKTVACQHYWYGADNQGGLVNNNPAVWNFFSSIPDNWTPDNDLRVSVSGFNSDVATVRYRGGTSYGTNCRSLNGVTIYSSATATTSLDPADYTLCGTFSIPINDGSTLPAGWILDSAGRSYYDITISAPSATQSLLLMFANAGIPGNIANDITKIQAFASTAPPVATTTVVSGNGTSTVGDLVTLTATVSATPTAPASGTVQFLDDGVPFGDARPVGGDGTASLPWTSFSVGTHPITATFSGTTGFDGSTSSPAVNQIVNPARTAYELWSDQITNGKTGANQDADADAVPNFIEFAFNSNPMSAASTGMVYVTTEMSGVYGQKVLVLTLAVRKGTDAIWTNNTATVDGLTYTIEGGATLNDFSSDPSRVEHADTNDFVPTSPGADYDWRRFVLSNSAGLYTKGFLRAMVESTVP